MNEVQQYIQSYFSIGTNEVAPVAELFKPRHLAKDTFFLKTGQYSCGMSFVKSGYLRVSASAPNGAKEVTQWIATPGSFITDLSSLQFNTPARWNIQTLTDCELYHIGQEQYAQIGIHVPKWPELERQFLAKCFITIENRMFSQLSMNAEEHYRAWFDQYPEMFNHVPLQYIASMLGMTPETFSRIRKKLSHSKSDPV